MYADGSYQETAAPLLTYLAMQAMIVEAIQEVRHGDVVTIPEVKAGDDLSLPLLKRALQQRQREIVLS